MRTALALCVSTWFLTLPAASQDRYKAPSDSVFLLVVNPYKMYWVRGADTVGQPVHSVAVEAQAWRQAGPTLQVALRQLELDVNRKDKVDTFAISPFGAVQAINGKAPGLNARVDLLLRLPGRKLVKDLTWTDTLKARQAGPSGNDLYEIVRDYRVRRLFDSAGSRLAEVTSAGRAHYKHSWWLDSAAGQFLILDVAGPDTERFVFSVPAGQLLYRTWSMHLVGSGTIPDPGGGVDTVPAGLISGQTQNVISPRQAHLLLRSLPGPDTAITISAGGTVLLHTVRRNGDSIDAGMGRNDGLVGTARARFAAGVMQSYEAVWTDTSATPREMTIALAGDSLRIRDPAGGDTVVAIPSRWWGIADYAMNEFLVPTFLAHVPDGRDTSFAVYRPYARHWDTGVAGVRRIREHLVASYLLGTDTLRTFLLITKDGDLLFGENSGPDGAQRVPPEGSVRRAELEAVLRTLRP